VGPRPRGFCLHFQNNNCRKGGQCRFRHELEGTATQHQHQQHTLQHRHQAPPPPHLAALGAPATGVHPHHPPQHPQQQQQQQQLATAFQIAQNPAVPPVFSASVPALRVEDFKEDTLLVAGRGLPWSTFQLNLSSFGHKIHPRHPLNTS